MRLTDRLKGKAVNAANRALESNAAQRVATSDAVRRVGSSSQIQAAKEFSAGQIADLGAGLRRIVVMDDQVDLSPERFLLTLIAAVRSDGEIESSLTDVRGSGKRNERIAAAAGVLGGGAGAFIGDMYADSALYVLLDDCFGLGLPDRDLAARLLVSWDVVEDLATASQVMAPAHPTTLSSIASVRLQENVTVGSKRETIQMLWRMRSGLKEMPRFSPSRLRDFLFSGRALEQRLNAAAQQLGIPVDHVRKPGLLRRRTAGH